MSNAGDLHWAAVKHILRYLKGIPCLGLTFNRDLKTLHGFCDADWGGDLGSRKSTTGYVFFLGGGPISWQSRLQKSTALSTCEAEYYSAGDATQECLWIRDLLGQPGKWPTDATAIHCDNQVAIQLTFNPEISRRIKHIDLRYHFIREHVEDGDIILEYVPTKLQAADILMKSLYKPTFTRCVQQLGLQ